MQSRLTCEVRGNHLMVAGVLDETAQLVRLLDHAQGQRLVLDLGGITFINSLGIREWIRMQQAAAAARIAIELVRVAEPLIHQMNIMPAARGVSIVSSFYAPYECDECDVEHAMLLDVRTHGADLANQRPPIMKCPDCGHELVFLDPPELYFMFMGV
jgi:hypothetical protein